MTGITDDFLSPTIDMFKEGNIEGLNIRLKDKKTREAFIKWLASSDSSTIIEDPSRHERSWQVLGVLASHASKKEDSKLAKVSALFYKEIPSGKRLALAESAFAKGLASTSWVLMKKTDDLDAIKSAVDKWEKDPSEQNIRWLERLAQDPTALPLLSSLVKSSPSKKLLADAEKLGCNTLAEIVLEAKFWEDLEKKVANMPRNKDQHYHIKDRFGEITLPLSLLQNIIYLRKKYSERGIQPLDRSHFFQSVRFHSESGDKKDVLLPMAELWGASHYFRNLYQDALQKKSAKGEILLTVPSNSFLDISQLQDLFNPNISLKGRDLSDLLKLWTQAQYLDTNPEIAFKIAHAVASKISALPLTEFEDDKMLKQLRNLAEYAESMELRKAFDTIAQKCFENAQNPSWLGREKQIEILQKILKQLPPVTLKTSLMPKEIAILKEVKGVHTLICEDAYYENLEEDAKGLEVSKLVLNGTWYRRVPKREDFPSMGELVLHFHSFDEMSKVYQLIATGGTFTATVIYPDGIKYEGEFLRGREHGNGEVTMPDGRKYAGTFDRGIQNGTGTLTWPDGRKYVGPWVNGVIHGIGELTWPDGRKYVGSFVHGQRKGIGTLTWPEGIKYEGEFDHDTMNGKGTYTGPFGYKYEGEFVNGLYEGRGKISWPTGEKYVGQFSRGLYNGIGTLTSPSGRKDVGNFINGQFQG